jgi:hypothetical protein
MGRIGWLVFGAMATTAWLCRWELPAAAAGISIAQIGASLFVGKLPLFDARVIRWGPFNSPVSWGGAQFGFLLATYFWERTVGFAGGEATWVLSISALFLYYALARIGCRRAGCCRARGMRVDSRLVEIALCLAACVVLAYLLHSGSFSWLLKYLALATLASIRTWSLIVTGEQQQIKFESLGFVLMAFAFSIRDDLLIFDSSAI